MLAVKSVFWRSPIDQCSKPFVSQMGLIGTQVFHKSFGYGEVIAISSDKVTVRFDNDKRKRDRDFMFPSSFYQGMLQL